jgi:hypothetical protein
MTVSHFPYLNRRYSRTKTVFSPAVWRITNNQITPFPGFAHPAAFQGVEVQGLEALVSANHAGRRRRQREFQVKLILG